MELHALPADQQQQLLPLTFPLGNNDERSPLFVHKVPTTFGPQQVVVVGRPGLPVVVTYHEAGLTPEHTFGGFMSASRTAELAEFFQWYHVYAPGTEHGAATLASYPSMDQLASQLGEVLRHFALVPAFVMGVGAGGNVTLRLASSQPDIVRGLVLVGTTATSASMSESVDTVLSQLQGFVWTSSVLQHACNRLLSRFFAPATAREYPDLVARTRSFLNGMSPNMLQFVQTYEKRDDITGRLPAVRAPLLFILGTSSPHADRQDVTYEELNPPVQHVGLRSSGPSNKSLVKLAGRADLLTEESPEALLHPLALFFVGFNIHPKQLLKLDFVLDTTAVPAREHSVREMLNRDLAGSVDESIKMDPGQQ